MRINFDNYKIAFIWFFLFSALLPLKGQEPFYYNIGDEKGFQIQQVYEVFQDKKGHLWFGANSGLFEFDGASFRKYPTEEDNSGSVSNVFEDVQGRIWTRNFKGQIFYTQGNNLVRFVNWEDSIQQFPNIFIHDSNQLFITSTKSLYRYSINSGTWKILSPGNDSLSEISFNTVMFHKLPNGGISLVFPWNEVGFIKNDSIHLYKINFKSQVALVFIKGFIFMNKAYFLDANNRLFEAQNDSLVFITDLSKFGLTERSVIWITALNDNQLAFATRNGLYLFNNEFKPVISKPYFQDKKISCVIKDHEGNVWLTTLHHGIIMIPNMEVTIFDKQNSTLPENSIYAIEPYKEGKYLVGLANGVLGMIDTNGFFNEWFRSPLVTEIPDIYLNTNDSSLYFINWSKLFRFTKKNNLKEFAGFLSAPKELKFYKNNLLIPTNLGITWIQPGNSPSSFLAQTNIPYDSKTSIHGSLFNHPENVSPSTGYFIRSTKKAGSVALDTFNLRLWGIFSDGVYWFKNGEKKQLQIEEKPVYGSILVMESDGSLWIASSKNVFALRDTTLTVQIPTKTPVLNILPTDSLVWYATIEGIYCYHKKTHLINTINMFDGISSLEIQDMKLEGQKMLLATPKGLITFPVNHNYLNTSPPGIEIKKIAIAEKDTVILPEYHLSYKENLITIELNAIAYKSHGTCQFKYRLRGLNPDWIQIPAIQNVIRFHSLQPGTYSLDVKAINEDGTESNDIKQIDFHISPPFWSTWWFVTLLLLLFLGLVALYLKIRIRNINHKNELKQLLKASEITAIKAQMNPHFIFNALNSIQDLILQKDFRASNLYLGKFSDLLRQVLEMSGKEMVTLEEELKILEVYLELEKLRFSSQFNYELSAHRVTFPFEQIMIPSMVIQPYVENAIKHGLLHKSGSKNLTILFTIDSNQLICQITDNGVGRAKAEDIKNRRNQHYRSFASNATSKRIDLYNELYAKQIVLTINDLMEDGKAAGTEVILMFPLHFVS